MKLPLGLIGDSGACAEGKSSCGSMQRHEEEAVSPTGLQTGSVGRSRGSTVERPHWKT